MLISKIKDREKRRFAENAKELYEQGRETELEYEDMNAKWLEAVLEPYDTKPKFEMLMNKGQFTGLLKCSACSKQFQKVNGHPWFRGGDEGTVIFLKKRFYFENLFFLTLVQDIVFRNKHVKY